MRLLRIVLTVLAVLLLLTGVVWLLQGLNILPGSFMTGQPQWAVAGVLAMAAAVAILFFVFRRSK